MMIGIAAWTLRRRVPASRGFTCCSGGDVGGADSTGSGCRERGLFEGVVGGGLEEVWSWSAVMMIAMDGKECYC